MRKRKKNLGAIKMSFPRNEKLEDIILIPPSPKSPYLVYCMHIFVA
jgi:hypothetical protein